MKAMITKIKYNQFCVTAFQNDYLLDFGITGEIIGDIKCMEQTHFYIGIMSELIGDIKCMEQTQLYRLPIKIVVEP